jgi:hypothetical protein
MGLSLSPAFLLPREAFSTAPLQVCFPKSEAILATKKRERTRGKPRTRAATSFGGATEVVSRAGVTHLIARSIRLRYNRFLQGKPRRRNEVNRMNHSTHLKLTDRYLYNEDFRQQMQEDPVGTAESTGLPLDDEDREAISNWDMSPTGDEVLKDRVSKLGGTN